MKADKAGQTAQYMALFRALETTPENFFGAIKLLKDLNALEERRTFGFEPEDLSAYLQQYNYVLPEDSGASNYRDKYLPDRPEKGYEFYHVAFATKV